MARCRRCLCGIGECPPPKNKPADRRQGRLDLEAPAGAGAKRDGRVAGGFGKASGAAWEVGVGGWVWVVMIGGGLGVAMQWPDRGCLGGG
jgi:hypothetical protein